MASGNTISEHKVLRVHKCIKVARNGKPSHCHSQCKLCFVAIVLPPVNSALTINFFLPLAIFLQLILQRLLIKVQKTSSHWSRHNLHLKEEETNLKDAINIESWQQSYTKITRDSLSRTQNVLIRS